MGQDESQVGPGVEDSSEDRGPEEIREDIEETRTEMGETVEALAEKADVKAQAQQRIDELKQTALQKKDELIGKAKQAAPGSSAGPGPLGSPDSTSEGGQQLTTRAQESAQQLSAKAQENPLPLAVGGALLVGFLLGRRGR